MRRRTWASIGIGATATLAATAVMSGALGPSGGSVGVLLTPSASATELTPFTGCEELRQWYVDAALPQVTPWGLGPGGPMVPYVSALRETEVQASAEAASPAATDRAVESGPTGTNVQEAGVDEPDLAKTDGTLVAHLRGRDLVLTDAEGEEPRRLSTLRLPRTLDGGELLLVGDRLVVLGTALEYWERPVPVDVIGPFPYGGQQGSTRALVVDVSDPTSPRIEHDSTFDGSLVSARQYGDVVRLVLSTATPAIDFVEPRRGRSPREAKAENQRLVRESDIEDWLPMVEADGSRSPLVECASVQHPDEASGYGTVTVVGFDPADPRDRRTTAVTTSSDLVYSSTDRLYLSTPHRRNSDVHAFALEGLDTSYVASGRVPGRARDRWSFSEHDERLRVATALGKDSWDPDENAVVVLEERGRDLVEVGRVGRMGIREQIQSVRWFGDVAVVVTFRQVDPLYTLDLSDPTAPRVVGELKIPGFSSYLHPVGGDLLLGLGQDASRTGRTRGAQAAVFDLADLADPRRLDTLAFGRSTEFAAGWDPRAFTYLADRRTALATMHDWNGRTRVVELAVGEDGRLSRGTTHPVAGREGYSVRTLPLDDGRVALVAGQAVQVIRPS